MRNPSRPSPCFLYCKRQKLHVEARELGRCVCDCVYGSLQVGAINTTSSFACFAHLATSPLVRLCAELLLPNCVRFSCCFQRDYIDQLLLPICIRFSCCSPLASASAAALDCVCFNCSPIASASAAAPRLCPLQLLLPDCVHFGCCSPIVSASAAAPRLRLLQLLLSDCVWFNCCSLIASALAAAPHRLFCKHSSQSSRL